jgi:hypothetical protein
VDDKREGACQRRCISCGLGCCPATVNDADIKPERYESDEYDQYKRHSNKNKPFGFFSHTSSLYRGVWKKVFRNTRIVGGG